MERFLSEMGRMLFVYDLAEISAREIEDWFKKGIKKIGLASRI